MQSEAYKNISNQHFLKSNSKKRIKHNKPVDIVFYVFIYTFFTLFSLLCILPFWYLFINTISNNDFVKQGVIIFLPKGIHFANYINIFKLNGLWNAMYISVLRTVLGTFCTVLGSSFVGYLVTKKEMWGRSIWYRFIIITMYFNAGIIPWYLVMRIMHLTNNFLAYIIPRIVSPFFIILVKTYIESIPGSLEEAAIIDGAGYLKIYLKIILPLSTPILATIAIFSAVENWNMFMDTRYLMTDENLFTLQFVLQRYLNESNYLAMILNSSSGTSGLDPSKMVNSRVVQMTVTMIVVLPILLIYPLFQRFFVKGIMLGAIKG